MRPLPLTQINNSKHLKLHFSYSSGFACWSSLPSLTIVYENKWKFGRWRQANVIFERDCTNITWLTRNSDKMWLLVIVHYYRFNVFFQNYYVYISLQSLFPKLSVLTKVRNIQLPTNGMINQSIDLDTLSHYDSLPKKVMPKLDQCNMIVREWQLWFFPNGRNHLWTCVIRMCSSDLCNCRFAWPKLDHKDPKATAH